MTAALTEEQLGILGRCPNHMAPCRDFKTGEDLWQKVPFLNEGQRYTIGRCPNTQAPCIHPPGDPNGVDLWPLVRGKAPQQEESLPTISPEEEAAILAATLPLPEPEPSFIRRNAIPLFVGGGVLVLGITGMFLMIKI